METFLMTVKEYQELHNLLTEIKSSVSKKQKLSPLGENWLDNSEVCMLLKISKRTLQEWRTTGRIPFSQHLAKIWYKASDISLFLENNHFKAVNPPRKSF